MSYMLLFRKNGIDNNVSTLGNVSLPSVVINANERGVTQV